MKPGVYVTFDVECGMGGAWDNPSLRPVPPSRAVMGQYGTRTYGLPLITEILAEKGLKATFFVEAFMTEQGHEGQGEVICKYLLDRSQDVQLHIHPNHEHFGLKMQGKPYVSTDMLAELSEREQRALLEKGRDRIRAWTGRVPVAFRSGNMSVSESVLEQLSAVGIRIDSSYSFPYAPEGCRLNTGEPYNGSRWYGDVLELALSGFALPKLPGLKAAKPLDLMGVSFEECRNAIRKICGAGADAVVILHSFSLFKVRNSQYEGGRPSWIVPRRFQRLCDWLSGHRAEFPTYTFGELSTAIAENRYTAKAVPPCQSSVIKAFVRKAVQVVNSIYWV
ncbi:MAG TPA: polysaccharide deacetylase family protein [Planctomycetota bacterium]|nr:polysaccharide deacetylase family protein [Phycisphaerae bacterium]HUW30466.1 polysaccharide deacetylase family protein [Planctomycetota bacterium]